MIEDSCEKSCEACPHRQANNCPSCARRLGQIVWILFWLTLLGTFSIRLTISGGDAAQQELFWSIAGLVRTAACGVLFLRLSREENTYRTAGLLTFASIALSLLTLFLPADAMGGGLILVLGLCGTGLSIAAEYYECSAHAALAEPWDEQLADKWRMLWKWRAAALIAAAAAMLLSAVPTLGLLLVLFVIAAMVVTGIWKLVCLYRTAKLFGSNG